MNLKILLHLLIVFSLNTCILSIDKKYKNRLTKVETNSKLEMRFGNEKRQLEKCEFNICEHVDNYPEEKIKILLNNTNEVQTFFGDIIKPHVIIESRSSFFDGPEPFCKSLITTKFPRSLKDINNEWKTVVNIEPPYIQQITFERCDFLNEGHSFCHDPNLPPLNYKFSCKQKFTTIKLVKYEQNKLNYGEFPIPSSCVCTYTNYM